MRPMFHLSDILHIVLKELEDEFDQELDDLIDIKNRLDNQEILNSCENKTEEAIILKNDFEKIPKHEIEKRLNYFVTNYLLVEENLFDETKDLLKNSIGNIRRVFHLKEAVRYSQVPVKLNNILLFSPFWIRDPFEWQEYSGKHIMEHLFVKYPLNHALTLEWCRDSSTMNVKWIAWFIILSQGGSLKKASKIFGWHIYSKFQHHFLQVTGGFIGEQACIEAEVRRMGGQELRHSVFLMQHSAYMIDPTDEKIPKKFRAFWYETVKWFINHEDKIDEEQYCKILNWARFEFLDKRNDQHEFSWKGRNTKNVVEKAQNHSKKEELIESKITWAGNNINWSYLDENGDIWSIKEITDGYELYKEGEKLKHCSGTHLSKCIQGFTSIFSLKCNGKRKVTIDMDLNNKSIIQAKGFANRSLNQKEKLVIKKWLNDYE